MSSGKRFLLMLIILAGIGYIYLKTKNSTIWGKTYLVVFDKVNGFGTDDPVYYKGAKVGHIKKTDFVDGNYIVTLFITKNCDIPVDSKATTLYIDPIKNNYVMNIIAGTSDIMLSDMDTLVGDANTPLKVRETEPMLDSQNKYDITKDTNLIIKAINGSGDTVDIKLKNIPRDSALNAE